MIVYRVSEKAPFMGGEAYRILVNDNSFSLSGFLYFNNKIF